jgi:hypothetical protein
LQEACDLFGAEQEQKLVGLLATDDALKRLRLAQVDPLEEPRSAQDLVDVRPRALLPDEMQLIGPNPLQAQLIENQNAS